MSVPEFSAKGLELIAMYETMANEGYDRDDDQHVDVAFSDFELRHYRVQLKGILQEREISTTLDYGCGGSDWTMEDFDVETGFSAVDYFGLEAAHRYEPARDIDERQKVDCVVSFDVLEHIFVSDVPAVLRDMFSYADKMLMLNVACYPAAAKLPNGENAHITVRPPMWWKGMVDSISVEYPGVAVFLICSPAWRKSQAYNIWSANDWQDSETFVTAN